MHSSDESSLSFDQNDEQNRLNKDSEDINALKTLQIDYNQLESEYLKSIHELECKFHEQCADLFKKRSDVINGIYEPSDDECRLKSDFIDVIQRSPEINDQPGISSFWLHTLKQVHSRIEFEIVNLFFVIKGSYDCRNDRRMG